MAKIRKYNLSWDASDSKDIAGYKVYWSEGKEVSYDSQCIELFNLTKVTIFDEVLVPDKPVTFGVTAFDFDDNESDITTLPEPFHVQVPKAPVSLNLRLSDEFKVIDPKKVVRTSLEQDVKDDPLADAIESDGDSQLAKMKYYNDIGYPRR